MEEISDQELLKIQSKEIQRLRRQYMEMQGQQDLMLFFIGFLVVMLLSALVELSIHLLRR